jgi:hypothetical protein
MREPSQPRESGEAPAGDGDETDDDPMPADTEHDLWAQVSLSP